MKKLFLTTLFAGLTCFVAAQGGAQRERVELYNTVEDASELKPGEDPDERIRKNFFLRAELSKTDCYVGEPLMATFKAYSRLDANSQVVRRPSLTGFSVVEMVDAYNNQPDVEKYNGNFYFVHLIRKVQLFPLQPGNLTIEPAEVESVIQLRSSEDPAKRLRLRDLFRRGRADPSLRRQVVFKTSEVDVQVKQLPEEGQPENFDGAVGNFSVELVIDNLAAKQHQPSKITVNIHGSGNFPLITDPHVDWPDQLDVPPPIVEEAVNKYQFPLSGVKRFQYTIDNRDTGTFTVPAVSFSFFDPATASYKSVRSEPLTFVVEPSENEKKTLPIFKGKQSGNIPVHYYYFGVVVLVIIGVILFLTLKKQKV